MADKVNGLLNISLEKWVIYGLLNEFKGIRLFKQLFF